MKTMHQSSVYLSFFSPSPNEHPPLHVSVARCGSTRRVKERARIYIWDNNDWDSQDGPPALSMTLRISLVHRYFHCPTVLGRGVLHASTIISRRRARRLDEGPASSPPGCSPSDAYSSLNFDDDFFVTFLLSHRILMLYARLYVDQTHCGIR